MVSEMEAADTNASWSFASCYCRETEEKKGDHVFT